MCGACRVSVGGEIKFVCVDGPEFNAHDIDFDELLMRLDAYKDSESLANKNYLEKRFQKIKWQNLIQIIGRKKEMRIGA